MAAAASAAARVRALPSWARALLLVGAWRAAAWAAAALRWAWAALAARRRVDLLQRYAGGGACWAVVTGDRGVAAALSRGLARRGFHVLILAGDEVRGSVLAQEIRGQYGVESAFIACDVAQVGQSDEVAKRLLRVISQATGGGDIGVLVAAGGGDDLAMHFTDTSLAQNRKRVNLNVLGTLGLAHAFIPRFVARPCRSAIITCGAITGRLGGTPGFAVSSGNKSFVRSFSRAISQEFRDHVDVICAHPVAVTSAVLPRERVGPLMRPLLLSPDAFAEGVLRRLGHNPPFRETCGHALHDLVCEALPFFESSEQHLQRAMGRVSWLAGMLNRPMDSR